MISGSTNVVFSRSLDWRRCQNTSFRSKETRPQNVELRANQWTKYHEVSNFKRQCAGNYKAGMAAAHAFCWNQPLVAWQISSIAGSAGPTSLRNLVSVPSTWLLQFWNSMVPFCIMTFAKSPPPGSASHININRLVHPRRPPGRSKVGMPGKSKHVWGISSHPKGSIQEPELSMVPNVFEVVYRRNTVARAVRLDWSGIDLNW